MTAPKLRFKEFDGDWTFKNLSDVSNKPLYGMNSAATDFDGENKYLRITDIDEESHRFKFTKLSSPSDVIEEKYILQEGDLLFARTGASVGKSYIYDPDDGKVVFAGFLIKFGLKESVIPYFIFTQTLSEKFNNWVITNSMRSGQPGINAEEYSKWQVAFTSKPEQTKIASFLSNVDEKISQLTQKHELLNQYKQGMMQKLFSQQIRFKADDGSEFGEWKSVFLGDISKPQQWKTISSSELTEIGYPVFGANGYIGFYPKYNHINETIAVTCRGATCGEVTLVKAKSYITGNAMSIDEINENEHSTLYIYYALCFRGFKDVISGSAQPQIVGNAIRKVTFQIPCLEEQTKIANFLFAIDQKIEVVAQQIEQAKQWKKGLLQQMFV
ncbi:restriction endonuclease subunit S [Acinetobacter towneri]|nr:restriction endonuclease subunit S [Acinetobacter towneri]MDM1283976.1 restriction endonuclease subunit S [Acinetobacter towneri]